MWSATLIASRSWSSKPQRKFGVHWPRPMGQKKKKKKQRIEVGGATETRKKCDHWVKSNHLRLKFSSSTPRIHSQPCTRTPLWVGEAPSWTLESPAFSLLFHLAAAAWPPDRQTALAHPPFLYYLFSFAYPVSLQIHPLAAAHCSARWQIATLAVCTCVSLGLIKTICEGERKDKIACGQVTPSRRETEHESCVNGERIQFLYG